MTLVTPVHIPPGAEHTRGRHAVRDRPVQLIVSATCVVSSPDRRRGVDTAVTHASRCALIVGQLEYQVTNQSSRNKTRRLQTSDLVKSIRFSPTVTPRPVKQVKHSVKHETGKSTFFFWTNMRKRPTPRAARQNGTFILGVSAVTPRIVK
eukprot:4086065-Pyramimonas_sp.AAC.2